MGAFGPAFIANKTQVAKHMIRAAIVGLGWWGQTQVEAVEGSDKIKFVAGTTRSLSDDALEFMKQYDIEPKQRYEDILADPDIDAVVLVTPNSQLPGDSIGMELWMESIKIH